MLTRLANWWTARQQNQKRSLERMVLRARWLRVERECWEAANTLTWLGFENGEAQQHIDAAKDAIYQAVLVAKEKLERAAASTQNRGA